MTREALLTDPAPSDPPLTDPLPPRSTPIEWCRRRLRPRRVPLALAAFAITAGARGHHHHGGVHGLHGVAVALVAVSCVVLLWRWRAPLVGFALSAAAIDAAALLGGALGPPLAPTFALMLVAGDPRTRGRLAVTAVVVFVMLGAQLAAASVAGGSFPATATLGVIALWGGAWIVGEQVSQRRHRISEQRERVRRARLDVDRERRLAAAEERMRIARDLHDSAAHAINVILVQAGAARLLQDRNPDAVRRALTTIEDVARETIGEIDHLIRGLREDDGAVEPPAGLAAVQTLAERHRAAGLEAAIHVSGTPRKLSPGVDQAAYRIVQESLTNAARHGGGPAQVEIEFGDEALRLTISNPLRNTSPAPASPPVPSPDGVGGHGILGMRERAALLGGTLAAGPDGDRFTVAATLPHVPRGGS